MKNKIAHLLFFMAVVVATGGCKKSFLEDMKSYEKFDESMFTSETLTGAYIDKLYNYYFSGYRSPMASLVGTYEATRGGSTEETGGTITWTNPNTLLNTATQADGYYGSALKSSVDNVPYTRIRLANFLIEKIDGGTGQALSADFKKTAKGQMYFLRALQYFDLVRVYGGVPIVTTVQNASSTDETIKLPRAKSSEVFDQIVKDLDSAAALLPLKWAGVSTDYGRASRAAALAIKSRVLLTAASPLFNANWDNTGDQKWQKALDASLQAETELSAAGFGKDINSAKDWGEMATKYDVGTGSGGVGPSTEGIFVIPLSNATSSSSGINNGWENTLRPKDYNGGGGISVPKGMIDLFPVADGSRPVIGSNYDDLAFFKKRDPRFYRTFEFSGEKWGHSKNANKTTWLYRWKASATANPTYAVPVNSAVQSPVLVRKFSNPAADTTILQNSGTDIFDFRYAELLLNIAEAYAATGKTNECLTYLNKIRVRVYPDSAKANNCGLGTSFAGKYAALEACLYERRVELAYEGKRFWDLQRWMLYDDDASIGDNTNAQLNIPILNGTARTGYYWQAISGSDPLSATEKNILIDPDAANFSAQIDSLAKRVTKFTMAPLDKALDNVSGTPVNILFRSNYYLSGLGSSVLSTDPWLPQTKGWLDYNGAMGTFDYRQ